MKKRWIPGGSKKKTDSRIIALAGNPNVGKSTVFNTLTGLKQHTGNWPGKTVGNAVGCYQYENFNYEIYDLPGTYSLIAHSAEEECARDFICFEKYDKVVVVCDAVCLERNLNLVLQTLEITSNVIVCVNLLDEAKKKKIIVDLKKLSKKLNIPVVGTSARNGKGLEELVGKIATSSSFDNNSFKVQYDDPIETAIDIIEKQLKYFLPDHWSSRFFSLKLLENDESLINKVNEQIGFDITKQDNVSNAILEAQEYLNDYDIPISHLRDRVVHTLVRNAEEIATDVIVFENENYAKKDRKIDKILTNKWSGIPIMLGLLFIIFWITMIGANYPSSLLSQFFHWIEGYLTAFFTWMQTPHWLYGICVEGIYRTLTWVIAVMLPPMALFFPMFTLLEDLGFLPRIAFNLDRAFQKSNACGKQALTMCMGFGCNAAGIVGCRIIDSPRERLIAILTNNFVPCNGRLPIIISIITMFLVGFRPGFEYSIANALILTGVILFGIFITLIVSKILSKTILKGFPSSFTLELPPYRRPQIGKVIVRSIFDRTLFVLGRAIAIAAPAGLLIWIVANVEINGLSILAHCSNFLDPFAKLIGLDGVILIAFLLGFPANEIVIPIMIMAYMATGSMHNFENLMELKTLLLANGWTFVTAICTMLFTLFHWPCSTTCLTVHKETKSLKWMILSFLIPTITGIVICFITAQLIHFFQFIF